MLDCPSGKVVNRIEEAVKQIRIVKEEVDDPEVSQELKHALESLQKAVKSLEDDGWFIPLVVLTGQDLLNK